MKIHYIRCKRKELKVFESKSEDLQHKPILGKTEHEQTKWVLDLMRMGRKRNSVFLPNTSEVPYYRRFEKKHR